MAYPDVGRPPVDLPCLLPLRSVVRDYAWGSRTVIARLQGRPAPSASPEAELWVGAHPSAPSMVALPDGTELPLDDLVAREPEAILGADATATFGPRLPFLLKLLAVATPLSLQAHPSGAHAVRGFADEQRAGMPRDAPRRSYRDPWAKPELICAVTPFVALCGFRDAAASASLLGRIAALRGLASQLSTEGDEAIRDVIRTLLTWPPAERAQLVAGVAATAADVAADRGPDAGLANWILRLAELHPHDPGVAVAMLMHLVTLQPGQAMYVPEGELHAYLAGTGIEIMGCSDNVLRGGLTAKHVDVDGLLEILLAHATPPRLLAPTDVGPGEDAYLTSTAAFRLSRLRLDAGTRALDRRGPQLLLAVDGRAEVQSGDERAQVMSGQAVFVTAAADDVRVRGEGMAYRATLGDAAD